MPRVSGLRERQHQPLWDTLVRASGSTNPSVQTRTQLFSAGTNVGDFSKTNLSTAGQLASDQTYVILALRCWMYFNGSNRRKCYLGAASQLYWTLTLGEKPQFQAPAWYFPAGGGIWGFDSGNSIFSNGTPDQSAIMKLAKPIKVPVRQNITAIGEFFAVGSANLLTDSPGLNSGRSSDDESVIMFMIDGQRTRDVQ